MAGRVSLTGRGAAGGGLDLDGDGPRQIDFDLALEILKPLLEDPGVLKVGHNIKYDTKVLARYGVGVTPVDDSMLISYVLEGGLHGHGMDELARLHLGLSPISFKEVAGVGKKQVTFDLVPIERARDYAAEDADVTLRLHRLLKPRLLAERLVTVYETLERPLIPVLVAMERAGIRVDRAALAAASRDFAERLAILEEEIYRLAGHPFTIGSPKQLGEVLFGEMGLAGGRKGKAGALSTDARVLDQLAAEGHELPARVLDWRQLAKLKSTYSDALIEQINPETGRVHTSYSMAAASTGRLASTDPNLQNIPVRTNEGRKIRRAFVAEEGHKLLSADYSQIELRLAAHVAEIEPLKQAFRDGLDIHAQTASQVFGVALDKVDGELRRRAKAINFGIIYGISPFGLARQLSIPQDEARAYIDAYFERYPGIRDYMERTKTFCRKHGYVVTMFGRRCHMPGINDRNLARRNFMERAAINAPLQGGAADIIKRAMIRVPEALDTAVQRGTRVVKLVGEVQEQAFLRELQWDTWGTHVMHVDFTRVSEHEKVEVEVEVELRGEAPGHKEGGAIDQPLHRLLLECEVTAIPEKVRVNINHLNLGDSITAGQLELPDGARLVADAETVVVQCVERAAEPEDVEGEGGEVEPEIIGRKKEEEETTE